jgi:3-oxoacyl-[acyl-carrier protein] reductase
MRTDLSGQVVFITGAAGGIGGATARRLAREGAAIVVADIDQAGAERVAAELPDALAVPLDVRKAADAERAVEAALSRFGRIDVLVNNAAIFTSIRKKPFDELTVEEWDRMFAVNVRGTWLCARAVAPAMKEARAGRIVNVTSTTVPGGVPLFLHYVASKAAIVGLTRALARELGEWGICVNAIAPDYVPHDAAYAAQQPEMAETIARQRCFQRDMTPDDLVGTLRYLVEPGSAFVTGQVLYVNGGRLFSGV